MTRPMTGRHFTLEPFPVTPPAMVPDYRIDGHCSRSARILTLRFELQGDLSRLSLAAPAAPPERRMGLWNATCFEFFLAPAGDPGYWEFNLSPARHWNVFRFSGYRQGMQEEKAFSTLPFNVDRGERKVELVLKAFIPLPIVEPAAPWRLAICTVLLSRDGSATYWALAHPGPEADFHHPKGFLVEL